MNRINTIVGHALLIVICYWMLLELTPQLGARPLINVAWAIMIPVTFINTFLLLRAVIESMDKEKK